MIKNLKQLNNFGLDRVHSPLLIFHAAQHRKLSFQLPTHSALLPRNLSRSQTSTNLISSVYLFQPVNKAFLGGNNPRNSHERSRKPHTATKIHAKSEDPTLCFIYTTTPSNPTFMQKYSWNSTKDHDDAKMELLAVRDPIQLDASAIRNTGKLREYALSASMKSSPRYTQTAAEAPLLHRLQVYPT